MDWNRQEVGRALKWKEGSPTRCNQPEGVRVGAGIGRIMRDQYRIGFVAMSAVGHPRQRKVRHRRVGQQRSKAGRGLAAMSRSWEASAQHSSRCCVGRSDVPYGRNGNKGADHGHGSSPGYLAEVNGGRMAGRSERRKSLSVSGIAITPGPRISGRIGRYSRGSLGAWRVTRWCQ